MTNEEVDRILAEARGLSKHETRHRVSGYNKNYIQFYCTCGRISGSSSDYRKNPEEGYSKFKCIFTDPSPTTNWADYGVFLEWMKEQNLWQAFVQTLFDKAEHDDQVGDTANIFTNPQTGSHALAEFLKERKETKDGV